MAFDGVPLLVTGGNTRASVVRGGLFAGTNGRQGVVLPGDLKVTATPTASQAVRIAAGGAVVLLRQAAGQSYYGGAATSTDVPIVVDGVARTDMVIGRIVDPEFSPWSAASVASATEGPFWEPFVLRGVSSGATKASDVVSYSALELARVAVPASGNVTSSMITDLRSLAQPRTYVDNVAQAGPGTADYVTTSETAWHNWPPNSHATFVPEWATHAQVRVTFASILSTGSADVNLRVQFGSLTGPIAYFDKNSGSGGGAEATTQIVYAEFDVRTMAGTTQTLRTNARRTFETVNLGDVWFDGGMIIDYQVTYSERLV